MTTDTTTNYVRRPISALRMGDEFLYRGMLLRARSMATTVDGLTVTIKAFRVNALKEQDITTGDIIVRVKR